MWSDHPSRSIYICVFSANVVCIPGAKLAYIGPRIYILIRYSAKPLLEHHALVWMVGFRMAGFMLSGSGMRVFVLGNMGFGWGGWEKVHVNDGGGWGCGRDGVYWGTG